MSRFAHINRRQMLAATGLMAGSLFLPSRRARAQSAAPPKRLIVMFTQHGTVYDTWRMRASGAGDTDPFELDLLAFGENEMSEVLRPLHAHRNKLLVLDGLAMASAEAEGPANGHDVGTRHALTGAMMQSGAAGGPSIDQIVAGEIALSGRINSLELSVVQTHNGGAVFRAAGQSLPPDSSPSSVFGRVFPATMTGTELTDADRVRGAQRSVLDLVRGEYDALAPRLGREDRQKLELHRDLVRDVEQRLSDLAGVQCSRPDAPSVTDSPSGAQYQSRADAMTRLVAAAVACDLTRVVTIQMGQLPNELIGAPPGDVHAEYAHNVNNNATAHQMMTNYGRVHAEQFGSMLAALDAIPEGNGTVLDNCAVVWCGELANGNHDFKPWPVVVGGGLMPGGRYVNLPRITQNPSPNTTWPNYTRVIGPPHSRFWVSAAQAVGANITSVGAASLAVPGGGTVDCSGPLPELA